MGVESNSPSKHAPSFEISTVGIDLSCPHCGQWLRSRWSLGPQPTFLCLRSPSEEVLAVFLWDLEAKRSEIARRRKRRRSFFGKSTLYYLILALTQGMHCRSHVRDEETETRSVKWLWPHNRDEWCSILSSAKAWGSPALQVHPHLLSTPPFP